MLRVIASYQGADFLRPYLSVETTADADGYFTLAGLSEGDYLVQSSLDNIWLSQPLPLRAGSGAVPLHLDIPMPGAGLNLKLHDSTGKPVAGVDITLDHPGPLNTL